jgi:hypothetical protein
MNKEFIPYTEALALKELGFDEPCLAIYEHKSKKLLPRSGLIPDWFNKTDDNKGFEWKMSAPIYQQAFRWFREKYDLHAYVDSMILTTGETVYSYVIEITDGEESDDGKNWRTYEEAEIACLKKLIEIAKNE